MKTSFVNAFRIAKKDIVCLSGAGGKTSLLYRLAQEARALEYRVLVTTTTHLQMPTSDQYDALDLTGRLFSDRERLAPGIYVGVTGEPQAAKVSGVAEYILADRAERFDLILIEADGAARKPLKGWKTTEPVIPEFATLTIGVLDIQTLGKIISEGLVHRPELFCRITGAHLGERVSQDHLGRLVCHQHGLFQYAQGRRFLFINKAESEALLSAASALARSVPIATVIGSLFQGEIYAAS